MIQAGGGFGFPTKAFQMRLRGPLAKANDFQCDCSVETFLARAINNALAASTDFLEQFVVTEIHQHVCWMAGIIDPGYSFVCERAETCLQNAGRA